MRLLRALSSVLALALLFSLSVSAQDISVDRVTLEELRSIFVRQQIIVQNSKDNLEKVKAQLQSLRELQKKDSEEYKSLESDYNELLLEHERETKLLQDLRAKLKTSQETVQRLEDSLKEANKSLKASWIKAGAIGAGAGAVGTLIIISIVKYSIK